MKTKIFICLAALGCLLMPTFGAVINGSCGDNLTWTLNTKDSTLVIEGIGDMTSNPWAEYRSYIAYVSFPDGLTSIGVRAFMNCDGLKSVTIPNSVTNIEYQAFEDCSYITSINMGNGVTNIGERAFIYCSSLTSVTLGNSVTSIGEMAFYLCDGLKNIYYTGSIKDWCTKSWNGGSICYNYTLYIGDEKISNLVITDDVTSIGRTAFKGCGSLTSVTIPNSVTSIVEYAFCDCYNLTSVTIGNGVTSISCAFINSNKVKTLTIFANTPPSGGTSSGINPGNCTLYVPAEAIETYANTLWWEDFQQIKAIEGNLFTVDFVDWNGHVIARHFVENGQTAIAPAAPTREGYTFIGWDKDFSCVTEDMIVKALYEEIIIPTYTVYYIDKSSTQLDNEDVELHLPEAPNIAGYTFLYWDVVAGHLSDGINIQAVYKSDTPTSAPATYANPANPAQKLIRNGNVYILTKDKTYTVTGQEVR